jgi:glycosyltransferase involved in cell wall biosynthesis
LTIVGAGDRSPATTEALVAQIDAHALASRVTLVGALSNADLSRQYGEADIFVMPSLFEGYGMVLAEAMARGLPIVCTTGGAAAETAPDSAAIKVPPGDIGALSDAIARVVRDRALKAAMAKASWSAGQTLPRWEDTARLVAGAIRKVRA